VAESFFAATMTALDAVAADVVIGSASSTAKGFLPRVAEQLDCGMASEILSVESGDTFTRALWAGNVIATVQSSGRVVLSVRATGFSPAETQEAQPQELAFEAPATKARFVGREMTESARPDLSEASVVVSGGRGTKGDFAPIEQLADALGAAMGASRAACDAGWVPNDLQVGQTGKVIAPNLYIAAGISGAIQHIAGMKGSKTIVAINKDEEAPIFSVADYGLVADLFEVCPELADKVSSQNLKPTA
jgi:electron transfer flavoprotein alpha subunit